ncbi:hypothetical protein Tco_0619499 [Tanacetum coccineum]
MAFAAYSQSIDVHDRGALGKWRLLDTMSQICRVLSTKRNAPLSSLFYLPLQDLTEACSTEHATGILTHEEPCAVKSAKETMEKMLRSMEGLKLANNYIFVIRLPQREQDGTMVDEDDTQDTTEDELQLNRVREWIKSYQDDVDVIDALSAFFLTWWENKSIRTERKLTRKINKPNYDTDREDSYGGDAYQYPSICNFEADAREVDKEEVSRMSRIRCLMQSLDLRFFATRKLSQITAHIPGSVIITNTAVAGITTIYTATKSNIDSTPSPLQAMAIAEFRHLPLPLIIVGFPTLPLSFNILMDNIR